MVPVNTITFVVISCNIKVYCNFRLLLNKFHCWHAHYYNCARVCAHRHTLCAHQVLQYIFMCHVYLYHMAQLKTEMRTNNKSERFRIFFTLSRVCIWLWQIVHCFNTDKLPTNVDGWQDTMIWIFFWKIATKMTSSAKN